MFIGRLPIKTAAPVACFQRLPAGHQPKQARAGVGNRAAVPPHPGENQKLIYVTGRNTDKAVLSERVTFDRDSLRHRQSIIVNHISLKIIREKYHHFSFFIDCDVKLLLCKNKFFLNSLYTERKIFINNLNVKIITVKSWLFMIAAMGNYTMYPQNLT
jgi:hypothetical protein